MPFFADLHIHTYYSRATSKACNLEGLHTTAQTKGIRVVGTGDITHPEWFAEIREKLIEAEHGLYQLRPELQTPLNATVPESCRANVSFMLTGEISSIYKRDGQTRKVHSVILLPDLASAEALIKKLDQMGNIRSDGRPILGLDPRHLLEILLTIHPDAMLIPAHIWTPWFSALGSKSGFNAMTNCFGELTQHIHAIETGLSSDPPMNWRLSQLDPFCLVSFSDLHSPDKMGRNATIFKCVPGFKTMREAIITQAEDAFGGTLELFPEEGKYHQDGHRKCGIVMTPEESLENDNTCPVCGKPLVLGVLHRVTELADRPKGSPRAHHAPMTYTIPLRELLAEIRGCGPNTKTVQKDYDATIATFGPELPLLTQEPLERINAASQSDLLTEAIRRVRAEEVKRIPGFDGEYGSISVFSPSELPYEKQRRKKPTAKPATPKKKAH